MSKVKDEAIALIEQMPDDSTLTDIMAELYFKQKVDRGLAELNEGKGVSHKQVLEKMKKWSK